MQRARTRTNRIILSKRIKQQLEMKLALNLKIMQNVE